MKAVCNGTPFTVKTRLQNSSYDLPVAINCFIKLYADDAKIFSPVNHYFKKISVGQSFGQLIVTFL